MPARADKPPPSVRGAALPVLAVVLGLAVFQAIVEAKLLSPDASAWKGAGGAIALALAGAEALLRTDWTFPLGMVRALSEPAAMSAPIAATTVHTPLWPVLFAKLLHELHGPTLNPLALTLLFACLAQPFAALSLLRVCGVRRPAWLAGGAVLALLAPVFLWSLGQPWADAQDLVLFALALAVGAARDGLRPWRTLGFAGLAILAPGFDIVFLIPIGGALAAAIAAEILQGRPGAWARGLFAAVRFALAAGVTAFLLGYGLAVPAALRAMLTAPEAPPLGSVIAGAGAGVLLLALAALFIGRKTLARDAPLRRFGPLAAIFAGLAIWGLATQQPALSCGAWGLMLAGGLAGLERLPDGRRAAGLLALGLLLQAANAWPCALAARHALRVWSPAAYPPGLDTGVADQRAFVVVPPCAGPDAATKARFAALALLAVRHDGDIHALDSCHVAGALNRELAQNSGAGDPRLLYVMPGGERPPGRTDCAPIAGGAWLCGRGMDLFAQGRTAEAARALEPGYTVGVATTDGRLALGGGWSAVEVDHAWSDGTRATFAFIAPRLPPHGLDLTFEMHGFVPAGGTPQPVEVRSNVDWLASWQVDGQVRRYTLRIPSALLQPGRRGWITFFMPRVYPGDAVTVHDSRALGVDLRTLTVAPAP